MNNTDKRPDIIRRIIIIAFAVVFFFIAVYLMGAINELEPKKAELENKLEREKLLTEELRKRYDAEKDEEYIEDVARENGYAYPDEQIYYNTSPK